MSGEPLLRVLIGAQRLPAPSDQPTLIVEAEAERVERLRQQLSKGAGQAPIQIQQGVLAARPGELTWYRFNDARLNGTVPLERLQQLYPNLKLVQEEQLQAHTLAEVLAQWPAAAESQHAIALTLSQGDPIQVLEGAGTWQQRIQVISLQTPKTQDLWLHECQAWCLANGFKPESQQPLCWDLDPLATELRGLRSEVDQLNQQLAEAQQRGSRLERTQEALHHVFPYQAYRERRPDLGEFSNDALVDHFINNGIQEGTDLRFDAIAAELRQLRDARQQEAARNALLERKSQDTAQQIDLLKDMFTRLMANP
jgi:cell division protein FtsB